METTLESPLSMGEAGRYPHPQRKPCGHSCFSTQSVNPPVEAPISSTSRFVQSIQTPSMLFRVSATTADIENDIVGNNGNGSSIRNFLRWLGDDTPFTTTLPFLMFILANSLDGKNPLCTRSISSRMGLHILCVNVITLKGIFIILLTFAP